MTYQQWVGCLHGKTVLLSRWQPAVLCGVRCMFFDVVIRCYVMCRCIMCCSLRYILHERNEFLNLFRTAAYRHCIGLLNPFVRAIGTYSLADLHHQYKKYIHKRPKHILL